MRNACGVLGKEKLRVPIGPFSVINKVSCCVSRPNLPFVYLLSDCLLISERWVYIKFKNRVECVKAKRMKVEERCVLVDWAGPVVMCSPGLAIVTNRNATVIDHEEAGSQ
jgi:hypothetical protein